METINAEMLAALKKCYEYFEDNYDPTPQETFGAPACQDMVEPMEAARIAISKAEAK